MASRLGRLAVLALAVLGLDQLTKALIVAYLPKGGFTLIPGMADIVLVYNSGAAFGFLSGVPGGRWLLTAATLVAVGVCLWLAGSSFGAKRGMVTCLGLIVGGALGNLVDRLRLGMVIDFIYLHAGDLYWPAFNVADMALTLAGLWLAWQLLRGKA